MSASLEAIVTINSDSEVIEFSKTASEMFGFTREEAVGAALPDLLIPPGLRAAHNAGMARYLETGEGPVLGKRIEITAIRKGGEEFPVELAISPLHIAGKRCFTAFIRDISETHDLNKRLRLTNFSVQQATDAVLWVRHDATFSYSNLAARERLGYTPEEFSELTVFDFDTLLRREDWDAHWSDI